MFEYGGAADGVYKAKFLLCSLTALQQAPEACFVSGARVVDVSEVRAAYCRSLIELDGKQGREGEKLYVYNTARDGKVGVGKWAAEILQCWPEFYAGLAAGYLSKNVGEKECERLLVSKIKERVHVVFCKEIARKSPDSRPPAFLKALFKNDESSLARIYISNPSYAKKILNEGFENVEAKIFGRWTSWNVVERVCDGKEYVGKCEDAGRMLMRQIS